MQLWLKAGRGVNLADTSNDNYFHQQVAAHEETYVADVLAQFLEINSSRIEGNACLSFLLSTAIETPPERKHVIR